MGSLAGELECCPLCLGKWQSIRDYDRAWDNYVCPNEKSCRMMYFKPSATNPNTTSFYLKREVSHHIRIWWSTITPCKLSIDGADYQHLNFVVPFNVDEKRLKLLLIMS